MQQWVISINIWRVFVTWIVFFCLITQLHCIRSVRVIVQYHIGIWNFKHAPVFPISNRCGYPEIVFHRKTAIVLSGHWRSSGFRHKYDRGGGQFDPYIGSEFVADRNAVADVLVRILDETKSVE